MDFAAPQFTPINQVGPNNPMWKDGRPYVPYLQVQNPQVQNPQVQNPRHLSRTDLAGLEAAFRITQHISTTTIHRMRSEQWRNLLQNLGIEVNSNTHGHELALHWRYLLCELINDAIGTIDPNARLDPDNFISITTTTQAGPNGQATQFDDEGLVEAEV